MNIYTETKDILQYCHQELGLLFESSCLRNNDDNRLWSYVTEINNVGNKRRIVGSGVDFSPQMALIKSMAESLERYFLFSPLPMETELGLLKHHNNCLPENMWPTFADHQILNSNFKQYHIKNIQHWASLKNIESNEKLIVPASLVWLSSFSDRFSPGISSGAACHPNKKQALLSSICEVVERDAFTIFWESMTLPPSIKITSIPFSSEIKYLIRKITEKQFSIKIFDITTEIDIPVYCVIIYSNSGQSPHICVGAACNLDKTDAVTKATIEAYQTWSWMCEEVKKCKIDFNECLTRLKDPDDMMFHPLLYTFEEAREYCDFMFLEEHDANIESFFNKKNFTDDKLGTVLSKLRKNGFQSYYLDIGNTISRNLSISIIKVIIPGLVPLSIGLFGKHFANPRIKEVPRKMKWLGYNKENFNPNPHPFP